MNTSQPFVIFSVYETKNSDNYNRARHLAFREWLTDEDIPFVECQGVYKGESEQCFLLADDERGLQVAENAANTYGQESILLVDANKAATLVYRDGTREPIGVWTSFDLEEGNEPDSYTIHKGRTYRCI